MAMDTTVKEMLERMEKMMAKKDKEIEELKQLVLNRNQKPKEPVFTLNLGHQFETKEVLRIRDAEDLKDEVKRELMFEYINHYHAVVEKEASPFYLEIIYDGNNRCSRYILRSTRKALEDTYETLIWMINDKPQRIMNIWLKHSGRSCFNRVVFEPSTKALHEPMMKQEDFNLFTGYNYDIQDNFEVELSVLEDVLYHIREVICGGNLEAYDYFLKLWANIIQNPKNKVGKATVLSGEQGVGKNIIMEWFGEKIIGKKYYYYTNNFDDIMDKFTKTENKLLTILDECDFFAGNHSFFNKMKSLITQGTEKMEKKFKDAILIPNLNNFVMISNEEYLVKIEDGDRRYFCLMVSNKHKGDSKYFKKLGKALDSDEVCQNFLHYLLQMDLSEWDADVIPTTVFKEKLKSFPNQTEYEYWGYLLGKYNEGEKHMNNETFFFNYRQFCEDNGSLKRAKAKTPLMKAMVKLFPDTDKWKKRNKKQRFVVINDECRAYIKCILEAKGYEITEDEIGNGCLLED